MAIAARDIKDIFDGVTEDKRNSARFAALAVAVIVAGSRLEIEAIARSNPDAAKAMLEHPEIARAIATLPNSTKINFVNWFQQRSALEVERARNKVNSNECALDYLANLLGDLLFNEEKAKLKGAIFTPPWLARHLTKKAIAYWQGVNPNKEQPLLAGDLSCGSGIFLASLGELLSKDTSIIGIDSCPEYVCLARLFSIANSSISIECLDTLLDLQVQQQMDLFKPAATLPASGYDIIVGNPPYVRSQLLNSAYAAKLKKLYPKLTQGNFDLVVLFLAHALNALAPGGVAALVASNKFMVSSYGEQICRQLGTSARILEIIDFGDGQVFPGRTTYSCAIAFAKLPPSAHPCLVTRFPPGLKWDSQGSYLDKGEKTQIPYQRFQHHPWSLISGTDRDILDLMRRSNLPRLLDVFPKVSQGIRTGANSIFILQNQAEKDLEPEVLYPYISGENIRRCQIAPTGKYLLWPYHLDPRGRVVALSPTALQQQYPKAWAFLQQHRQELTARNIDSSAPWYGYSRSQNLELQRLPKIIARELMPRAEFAADLEGRYALCSGYALVAPPGMSGRELRLWAAVLSTQTMEFQLRYSTTGLHSGWFRILKQHLKQIRLPPLSEVEQKNASRLADLLHDNPNNDESWESLDALAAKSFGLTDEMRREIREYLARFHAISNPMPPERGDTNSGGAPKKNKENKNTLEPVPGIADLTAEQRQRYLPVELPMFDDLQRDRSDLRQLVTFVKNKTAPIFRWYNFTQGFSGQLVRQLLSELNASQDAIVYDPFAGSGTTLLACRMLGIESFGTEISPLLAWVANLKSTVWDKAKLRLLLGLVRQAKPEPASPQGLLFLEYLNKAYAPEILSQIVGWRNWIDSQEIDPRLRDFLLLGLIGILEEVSQIRKHGSHYRFLNKPENVGLAKLNIATIDSSSELKPILLSKLESMVADVENSSFKQPLAYCKVNNLDARFAIPESCRADLVITSPPYLNRNNYIAQQKAELSLLNLLPSYEDYRKLVRSTFRSHVESALSQKAESDIPEVNEIVNNIELSENNNPKIPQMICGYFDDLQQTLLALSQVVKPNAKLAFVVANSRWGGVVVPVDRLLALIARELGYHTEQILVTRLKGNSPQQMRRYGRIPLRESIVILRA